MAMTLTEHLPLWSAMRLGSCAGCRGCLVAEPAVAVAREAAFREAGVGLGGVRRLTLDACAVAERGLVDGVGAPVGAGRAVAGADAQNQRGRITGADDHVVRPRGAVHEVPPAQHAFLAL